MFKKTKEEFIRDAIKIHDENYNYSKIIYINNKQKINIFCNNCKKYFLQRPDNHLNGAKCFNCYGNVKYSNKEFIDKCNEIHNNKYIYSHTTYNGMTNFIIITCKIHGDFNQKAHNHFNGQGCVKCSHIIPLNKEKFINKANIIHNNLYDYNLIKINGNNKSKVKIICNKHGVFEKSINGHLTGQGCPSCKNIYKGEFLLKSILKEFSIEFEYNKKFQECKRKRLLSYDCYLPPFNTCIELDGIQHRSPVKRFGGDKKFEIQMEIDKIKTNFCKDNNINLIRIEYNGSLKKLGKLILEQYRRIS